MKKRKKIPAWLKFVCCHIAAAACVSCSGHDIEETRVGAHPEVSTPATSPPAPSRGGSPETGEYATDHGWGRLLISRQGSGSTSFSIETTTGESICRLGGQVVDSSGVVIEGNDRTSCAIRFSESESGIAISTTTPDECRSLCGDNAGFEGVYRRVGRGCHSDEIESTRREFKLLYDQKKYQSALAMLTPVLDNCAALLDWEEAGRIRNDIALTQHKVGLDASCLKTLEPYAEDARKEDDEAANGWPPALSDRYLAVIKAARTNIRLCSAGAKKK
jgi:hypothetical protein